MNDVIWDFINELLFCSPKHLWMAQLRPIRKSRVATVADRALSASSEQERVSHLQKLWRTTADDVFELPQLKDFESVHLIDDRQPLKRSIIVCSRKTCSVGWTRQMTDAARSNGNAEQLITVGQDEAGLGDSPNIQFFARRSTSLLCIMVGQRRSRLGQCVGEDAVEGELDGRNRRHVLRKPDADAPWRSEQEVSDLPERKMRFSLAVDGAGFIEWVWNTNPYMNSTNEVGIGFY